MLPKSKILFIDSFNENYPQSDGILEGIRETFRTSNIHLRVLFMDYENHNMPESIEKRVNLALAEIKQFQPAVIIVSGDMVLEYVVADNLKTSPFACVFCGTNWDYEKYGLPTKNITGINEAIPFEENIVFLRRYYPDAKKLTVISGGNVPAYESRQILASAHTSLGFTVTFVEAQTYAQWTERFIEANKETDIIYLASNYGIKDWNAAQARAFVQENIQVPVFTCKISMIPYAAMGIMAVPQEQGRWAAQTALKILNWKKPSDIPMAKSGETKVLLNRPLAQKINFEPDEKLIQKTMAEE